jgi:hypothetical protein
VRSIGVFIATLFTAGSSHAKIECHPGLLV